jgi:hypothetical protein
MHIEKQITLTIKQKKILKQKLFLLLIKSK